MNAKEPSDVAAARRRTQPLTDEALGVAWFNGLSEYQRCLWLTRAGSSVPADAWAIFKASLRPNPELPIVARSCWKHDRAAHHCQHSRC